MEIVFVTPELHPYSKVGGLADAVAGLAKALRGLGHRVAVVTPFSLAKISLHGAAEFPLWTPGNLLKVMQFQAPRRRRPLSGEKFPAIRETDPG